MSLAGGSQLTVKSTFYSEGAVRGLEYEVPGRLLVCALILILPDFLKHVIHSFRSQEQVLPLEIPAQAPTSLAVIVSEGT